jgi:hypothetical protein
MAFGKIPKSPAVAPNKKLPKKTWYIVELLAITIKVPDSPRDENNHKYFLLTLSIKKIEDIPVRSPARDPKEKKSAPLELSI